MSTPPTTLYEHTPHQHTPQNPNETHRTERFSGSGWKQLNERIAVAITNRVGTMEFAYLCTFLAVVGLLGLLGKLNPITFLLAGWASQQFIQLVCLPLLQIGQNVTSRKQEIQADELYATAQHTFHDIGELTAHQHAQDAEAIAQRDRIVGLEQQITALRAVIIDRDDALAALLAPILSRLDTLSQPTPAKPKLFARFRQK